MHSPFLRTRIIATLGPASAKPEVLESLIQEGASIFRLNMSHGTQDSHLATIQMVRDCARNLGIEVTLLGDLCGPKIRVGVFSNGQMDLQQGQTVTLDSQIVQGGGGFIHSQYPHLARDVTEGCKILLDDGLLELKVLETKGTQVKALVVRGGTLKNKKGMNLPGAQLSIPALTEKDRSDAAFLLAQGVDYLALSFVRTAADLASLKECLKALGRQVPIIAKIEMPQALDNIEEILETCEGIMVARGDLGVELEPERVPIIQKELIRNARAKSKPVIVATQMLESMTVNLRPTRAEVSDVSNAVFDGADAVMLSGETAAGAHPVEAVAMMRRVALEAEKAQACAGFSQEGQLANYLNSTPLVRRSVAQAMRELSRELPVSAILVRSRGGKSAGVVSATRPAAPIVAFSTELEVIRRMNLLWGVKPVQVSVEDFEDPKSCGRQLAARLGYSQSGKFLLLLSGFGKSEPAITLLPT